MLRFRLRDYTLWILIWLLELVWTFLGMTNLWGHKTGWDFQYSFLLKVKLSHIPPLSTVLMVFWPIIDEVTCSSTSLQQDLMLQYWLTFLVSCSRAFCPKELLSKFFASVTYRKNRVVPVQFFTKTFGYVENQGDLVNSLSKKDLPGVFQKLTSCQKVFTVQKGLTVMDFRVVVSFPVPYWPALRVHIALRFSTSWENMDIQVWFF